MAVQIMMYKFSILSRNATATGSSSWIWRCADTLSYLISTHHSYYQDFPEWAYGLSQTSESYLSFISLSFNCQAKDLLIGKTFSIIQDPHEVDIKLYFFAGTQQNWSWTFTMSWYIKAKPPAKEPQSYNSSNKHVIPNHKGSFTAKFSSSQASL